MIFTDNRKIPTDLETCPFCKDKIYLWKHYMYCKHFEKTNNKTREELIDLCKYVKVQFDGDILLKILED